MKEVNKEKMQEAEETIVRLEEQKIDVLDEYFDALHSGDEKKQRALKKKWVKLCHSVHDWYVVYRLVRQGEL